MNRQDPFSEPQITLEKSNHLKGIAVILLFYHHLFGVEYLKDWISVIPGCEGADYVIGASGKICLAIFLFCSGFGLYRSYIAKKDPPKGYILNRLIKTLVPYWIVMLIAIAYLIYAGKFEPRYLVINLFAMVHDEQVLYVSFSWFILLYILLILLLPLLRFIGNRWRKNAFIDILIYMIAPFVISLIFGDHIKQDQFLSIPAYILSTVLFVLSWFPLFASGMLFAKYDTYRAVRRFADRFPGWLTLVVSILILCNLFYLRFFFYNFFMTSVIYRNCMADLVFGPAFVCFCLIIMDNIKHRSRYILPFLGQKSVFYWLLSGMFFLNTSELSFLITWPRVTILILIWNFLLLTPFVFACDWISGKITGLVCKKPHSRDH